MSGRAKDLSDLGKVDLSRPEERGTPMNEAGGGRSMAGTAGLVCLADVKPVRVEWLWEGRIALGKLTVLAGNPGVGKSTLTADLAARTSSGAAMPGGGADEAGDVLILNHEDDPADTILPRILAANGDPARVTLLRSASGKQGSEEMFRLTDHVEQLEKALAQMPNPRLVIIDPLSAYMGRADTHKDSDVRGALLPLQELAERLGVAVVLVSHLNKSGANAQFRVMGSIGITGVARSVLVAVKDDSEPDVRILACLKSNVAMEDQSLAYRIVPAAIALEDGDLQTSMVEWLGSSSATVDGLLSPEGQVGEEVLEEAVEEIRQILGSGQVLSKEYKQRVSHLGLSRKALLDAERRAGVKKGPSGKGEPWVVSIRPKNLCSQVQAGGSRETSDTDKSDDSEGETL